MPQPRHLAVRFSKNRRVLTIGRDPDCDVPLKGIGASRRHAIIRVEENSVSIEDCRSTFAPASTESLSKAPISKTAPSSPPAWQSSRFKLTRRISRSPNSGRRTVCGSHASQPYVRHGNHRQGPIECNLPASSAGFTFHATFRQPARPGIPLRTTEAQCTFVMVPRFAAGCLTTRRGADRAYRFFLDDGSLKQTQDFNRIRIEAFTIGVKRGKTSLISECHCR